MATQICPKCQEDSFTWHMDEEESQVTIWWCYKCSYSACEDQKLERECSNCHNKTESLLIDEEGKFWWCNSCNRIIKETKLQTD